MKKANLNSYGLIPLKCNNNYEKIHIFINGFMTDEEPNPLDDDWLKSLEHLIGSKDNVYLYRWESGFDYLKMKNHFTFKTKKNIVKKFLPIVITKTFPILNAMSIPFFFIDEWKMANKNCKEFGIKLANDLYELYKFETKEINIYAHSLGTNLVKHSLLELSNKTISVNNIFLFGGATNTEEYFNWVSICEVVNGGVYNFYTKNDEILKKLYKFVELGCHPIGLKPIDVKNVNNLFNIDVTYTVNSHFEYKKNLPTIFRNLKQ